MYRMTLGQELKIWDSLKPAKYKMIVGLAVTRRNIVIVSGSNYPPGK